MTNPTQSAELPAPIDMVLHCPACGHQHIDASETDEAYSRHLASGGFDHQWTNPPHRSHLCHECGHIWRPADVPTNGVLAVMTKGFADSPLANRAREAANEAWRMQIASQHRVSKCVCPVCTKYRARGWMPIVQHDEALRAAEASRDAEPVGYMAAHDIDRLRSGESGAWQGLWRVKSEANDVPLYRGVDPADASSEGRGK